jgi:hypothetical protein
VDEAILMEGLEEDRGFDSKVQEPGHVQAMLLVLLLLLLLLISLL